MLFASQSDADDDGKARSCKDSYRAEQKETGMPNLELRLPPVVILIIIAILM